MTGSRARQSVCSPTGSLRIDYRAATSRSARWRCDDVIEVAAPVLSAVAKGSTTSADRDGAHQEPGAFDGDFDAQGAEWRGDRRAGLRGDYNVVQNTVNNPGAEFSERGFTRLVNRAEGGRTISATCVGLRRICRGISHSGAACQGIRNACGPPRSSNPRQADEVPAAVREGTEPRARRRQAISRETAIAHAPVKSLYEDGRLDEHQVETSPRRASPTKPTLSIAALANVTVTIAENMMIETRPKA